MSRKKIVLLSITGVLSLILALQIGFGGGQAFRELTLDEGAEINRITVTSAEGDELTFFKENKGWVVTDQRYPADQGKVENLVEKLKTVKVVDTVSSRSLYERYEVDEARRLTVTARQDDTVLRTLHIGKASATSRQSYLLADEDGEVLLVSGNYRRDFEKKAEDFRDKKVFAIDQQTITGIALGGKAKDSEGEFTIQVDTFTLSKDNNGTWLSQGAAAANGSVLDQEKVSNYLRNFSSLTAADYAVEGLDVNADPLFSVQVTTLEGNHFLHVVSKTDNGFYLCTASTNPYPFRLSSYNAEKFIKTLADFTSG